MGTGDGSTSSESSEPYPWSLLEGTAQELQASSSVELVTDATASSELGGSSIGGTVSLQVSLGAALFLAAVGFLATWLFFTVLGE